MQEQQEGYRPPIAETKVEGPKISTAKEAAMPSIEDVDALLRESENIVKVAAMSEKEIDEMIKRRQEALDRLRELDLIRESRLQEAERYNPLGDLRPDDYDRLVQEGMIDMSYAERLKKLGDVIAKFEAIDYPTADTKAQLERLSQVRNAFREKLESQIAERQQEIAAQREEMKNNALKYYAEEVEKLQQIIKEIEANPRVIERLRIMAEKERQAFQAKIEQEQKRIIQEATRYLQSLGARHTNAFRRIGNFVGNEKIVDELMQAFTEGDDRKQRNTLDKVRSRLIDAIINGEGEKQLKDPKEIVPWKVTPTTIRYREAMNFLQWHETEKALQAAAEAGNRQAQKLLEQRKQIILGNEILRRLVGPEWITDRKTGKRHMSAFWAAFETRKKNDKEGITAVRQKEREEAIKREATFKKETEEIIKRGGFVVEVPIIKVVRGKREIVGREKCAVRLEKGKSKERIVKDPKTGKEIKKGGNEYWKVVEIFGTTNGLKVGDVSPLDMRAFPQWFRDSARPHFVKHGEDFVERLIYREGK